MGHDHPRTMKIWEFNDAPVEYQTRGVNGQWVAFVPQEHHNREQMMPRWIDEGASAGVFRVFEFKVEGGRIYIGAHP